MNIQPMILDIKMMLFSKRAVFSIMFLALFALMFAAMVEYSPQGLKDALEAAAPDGSAGAFEYLWFEDVLKLLLLMVVSFGAFVISDPVDDETLELMLARPESRLQYLMKRSVSSVISFIVIFMLGSLVAGIIAWAIVGGLDLGLFLVHQVMIIPLMIFVMAMTFFFSVPLKATTPTVLAGFASALFLSFTYSFGQMANPGSEPSILNPLAYGFRVMAGQPLFESFLVVVVMAVVFAIAGAVWFMKKDI
ncbi:MAG: ABC transporter permease subunit [Thermoplasmata archaeon]|nr:ABC transporter permease subunit [Thermoplasmata archaeon]